MAGILIAAILACASSAVLLAFIDRFAPPSFLVAAINPRSNHAHRPRQLGGLGLIAAWVTALAALGLSGFGQWTVIGLGLALLLLLLVGFLDDMKHRPVLLRLVAHAAAAGLALSALPQLVPGNLPMLPPGTGLALSMLVLVAAINIVNFMDGLDLMSVAGAGVPLGFAAAALAAGGGAGEIALLAACAAAGLLAFGAFNRPPARLFLGDSGSLPVGLVCGLALLSLEQSQGGLSGLLPFAYYLTDGLSTIAIRAGRFEPFWRAHSQHAYQKAYRAGLSAFRVSGLVAIVSVACGLILLAARLAGPTSTAGGWLAPLAAGALALALTLFFRFAGRVPAKT